jgi:hypothetical protein
MVFYGNRKKIYVFPPNGPSLILNSSTSSEHALTTLRTRDDQNNDKLSYKVHQTQDTLDTFFPGLNRLESSLEGINVSTA